MTKGWRGYSTCCTMCRTLATRWRRWWWHGLRQHRHISDQQLVLPLGVWCKPRGDGLSSGVDATTGDISEAVVVGRDEVDAELTGSRLLDHETTQDGR